MKKRVSVLVLAVVLSTFTSFFAYSAAPDAPIPRQQNAYKAYKDFLENKNSNKSIDVFSGAYIDEQGILNINIAGNSNKLIQEVNEPNTKYHTVKWTKNQLIKAQKKLSDDMEKYNIIATELDEINNTIIVYLKTLNNDAMEKITDDTEISNITFRKMDLEVTFTSDIINSSKIQ